MKKILLTIVSLLLGLLIGFFGVLVSVFADGAINERLVTIGVVLIIYASFGFLFGMLDAALFRRWSLLLGIPGVLILGLYAIKDFDPYYLLYMLLIVSFTSIGTLLGKLIKSRKGKAPENI